MIERDATLYLKSWKTKENRKPLIIQGARQVGKTTLINKFSAEFDDYLYFNLDKIEDAEVFQNIENLSSSIQLMFIAKAKQLDRGRSQLIFIDEVQDYPQVIEALRYFYEDYPYLFLVVTGSLLRFGLDRVQKVPVGRVEYLSLSPISFKEYLRFTNKALFENIDQQIPIPDTIVKLCYNYFHEYVMIGGMPEIVSFYHKNEKNLTLTIPLYSNLLKAYSDDVEKYGSNETERKVIRHVLNVAAYELDNRIVLSNFGNSSYRNREVKEAFDLLEKAKLMKLIYPTTSATLPLVADFKKRPRLHFLDVGLINHSLQLHTDLLKIEDLNDSGRGKILSQIVYQELFAQNETAELDPKFWVRKQNGSNAEVDVVLNIKGKAIPVEIKSGASGTLRSLHEFMDKTNHDIAIRLYKGPIQIDKQMTRLGKEYRLLNLPYFLTPWLQRYIETFMM